jgi:hypothetical protein
MKRRMVLRAAHMPLIMNNAHHDGLMTPCGPILGRFGPSNMNIAPSERP